MSEIKDFDGQSFRAPDWADAFCARHPAIDRETMIGWFANAIMRGYDEAKREALLPSEGETRETIPPTTQSLLDQIESTAYKDSAGQVVLRKHEWELLMRLALQGCLDSSKPPAPSSEKALMEAALGCIPSNWLDPLLTGPDAVVHECPAPEIEALLNGVRTRVKALSSSPAPSESPQSAPEATK